MAGAGQVASLQASLVPAERAASLVAGLRAYHSSVEAEVGAGDCDLGSDAAGDVSPPDACDDRLTKDVECCLDDCGGISSAGNGNRGEGDLPAADALMGMDLLTDTRRGRAPRR